MSVVETPRCSAPTCTRLVPPALMACGAHWWSLPLRLREGISRAWRVQNLEHHRELVAEATAYLQELNPA